MALAVDESFLSTWNPWASSACMVAEAIIKEAESVIAAQPINDPVPLAVMLVSRTLSNFIGSQVLLREGLLVEARVLVRCCFENVFWLAGLCSEGEKFAQLMRQDEAGSTKRRMEFAVGLSSDLAAETKSDIKKGLSHIAKNWPTPCSLSPKEVAVIGKAKDAYLIYCQLSADSAHPSLSSLLRHVSRADGGHVIAISPNYKESDFKDTYGLAGNAMLGACVALNELLDYTAAGDRLGALADAHIRFFEVPQNQG